MSLDEALPRGAVIEGGLSFDPEPEGIADRDRSGESAPARSRDALVTQNVKVHISLLRPRQN